MYMYMCVSREGFGRSNTYICDEFGPPDAPVSYFVRFGAPGYGKSPFFLEAISWIPVLPGTIKGGVLYTIHCTLITDS